MSGGIAAPTNDHQAKLHDTHGNWRRREAVFFVPTISYHSLPLAFFLSPRAEISIGVAICGHYRSRVEDSAGSLFLVT